MRVRSTTVAAQEETAKVVADLAIVPGECGRIDGGDGAAKLEVSVVVVVVVNARWVDHCRRIVVVGRNRRQRRPERNALMRQ